MIDFDKNYIREQIEDEDIMNLLTEFGGSPSDEGNAIVADTICHNRPGEGSHKLYYYKNSKIFHCYTGCEDPTFDIFELVRKVFDIQNNKELTFNQAIRWVANKLNIEGEYVDEEDEILPDWKYLENYARIQEIDIKKSDIVLKEYDKNILSRFNYTLKIEPWLKEGISQNTIKSALIGYYPGEEQITIPHFDINNRFVGLRGRALVAQEAEKYGKYRPLKINNNLYNHPLGMNLYNLNFAKDNIKILGKAIVFESEKSSLKYKTFFGEENDISVATCGSNISDYQMKLLIESGAKEIILAFDRDFEEIGDEKFKRLKNKIIKIHNKYKNEINISFIWDKKKITGLKDSPIDESPQKFLKLFKERIIL